MTIRVIRGKNSLCPKEKNRMDVKQLLQTLTETPGPSGQESPIAQAVTTAWTPYVDLLMTDALGNLIGLKKGDGEAPRPRILLAAHMDEIALLVTQVLAYPDENGYGFLKVTKVGGVDTRQTLGQQVLVHGQRELPGVIGCLPPHLLPENRRSKPIGFEDMVVDVGLPYVELKQLVGVGDFVSFRQPLRELHNGRVAGKSLDNRASVAAVTVCLDWLRGRKHSWDVIAVATTQEEIGLRGAFVAAGGQQPDLAIALDVTWAKGPLAQDGGLTFELGEGPTLGYGPNIHPGIYKGLQEAAAAIELKVTPEGQPTLSGTDAAALQIARAGIPTGLICIPQRYMHTMVETMALNDIERTGRLLAEFIARLDGDFLNQLNKSLMDG